MSIVDWIAVDYAFNDRNGGLISQTNEVSSLWDPFSSLRLNRSDVADIFEVTHTISTILSSLHIVAPAD